MSNPSLIYKICNSLYINTFVIVEVIKEKEEVVMNHSSSIEELNFRVKQQEETVAQLVRIIASTNHRVSELQISQEKIEKEVNEFQRI